MIPRELVDRDFHRNSQHINIRSNIQMDYTQRLIELGFSDAMLRTTETSNVTTAWGVKWSEDMIARDLLQNFFDSNKNNVEAIKTSSHGTLARIEAPVQFDLRRLYYLGSEKTSDDVGQYGEGFKASAVSYLRIPGRTIYAASGGHALAIHPDSTPIPGTESLYPLVYEFFSIKPIEGCVLVLDQCSNSLAKILGHAIENFFYPKNPCLGEQLWDDSKMAIYRSNHSDGAIFYRSLKRGVVKGIPLVFVLRKPYSEVEKRIGTDRDRKEFSNEIRDFFLRHINAKTLSSNPYLQSIVLNECRGDWERGEGNSLLEIMSRGSCYSLHAGISETISSNFFASCKLPHSAEGRLQHQTILASWRKAGRIQLPSYFSEFGVQTVETHIKELSQQAMEEAMQKGKRKPIASEREAIDLLRSCLAKLAPAVAEVFSSGTVDYTIGKTKVLLGQLKSARSYRSREVFFSDEIFSSSFATALSIFLHEHSHIFGYDGQRGFSDALTELIEQVIANRKAFDSLEHQWNAICAEIFMTRDESIDVNIVIKVLTKLSKKVLQERLATLPLETLLELTATSN